MRIAILGMISQHRHDEIKKAKDGKQGEVTYLRVKFWISDLEGRPNVHNVVERREKLVDNAHRGETTKVPQSLEGHPTTDESEAQPTGNACENQIGKRHCHDAFKVFAQYADKTDAKEICPAQQEEKHDKNQYLDDDLREGFVQRRGQGVFVVVRWAMSLLFRLF